MIFLEDIIQAADGGKNELAEALSCHLNELSAMPEGTAITSNGKDVVMHLPAGDYPVSLVREKNENGAIWGCILLYKGKSENEKEEI